MAIVTLSEAKAHLRILHDDEDALVSSKISAATAHLESLLGFEIEVEFATVPEDFKQAVLALVGHWYENREATGEHIFEAPLSVWDIVRERRAYTWE